MTNFVALGDSITVGMGDPLPDGTWRGWAALLAPALGLRLHNLAVSGALSTEMEREQLPRALELRPALAAVVVGVNDTLRRDFDVCRVGAALAHSVGALSAAGATVLTMRLPDPGRMFGLPGTLSRPLGRRIRSVNASPTWSRRAIARCTSTRPGTRRRTTVACGAWTGCIRASAGTAWWRTPMLCCWGWQVLVWSRPAWRRPGGLRLAGSRRRVPGGWSTARPTSYRTCSAWRPRNGGTGCAASGTGWTPPPSGRQRSRSAR